jgi:homospermidine synthase
MNTWVRSWVPSGEIKGMLIRHGEAYSLSHYLTVHDHDGTVYRPTVHYAYCPCDGAINSMHELEMRRFAPQERKRILNNEIVSGYDELGCLLMGHDFKAWWIGSILGIEESRKLLPGQSATTLQVAVGVLGACLWMIQNPNKGFCQPENLDHEAVLNVAKPYLGEFISTPVDWTPLQKDSSFSFSSGSPAPKSEDEWQFSTFLVSHKDYIFT